MNSKKLVVLCAPFSAVGHTNAFRGLAVAIKNRGHRVVFAIDVSWKGKLIIDGFEEEIYKDNIVDENQDDTDHPAAMWSEIAIQATQTAKYPRIKSLRIMSENLKSLNSKIIKSDPQLKLIIDRVKPDVIITELRSVAMTSGDIPYVSLISGGPLTLPDPDRLAPPFSSGLSMDDKHKWEEYREEMFDILKTAKKETNDWLNANGCPSPDPNMYFIESKFLNLYLYPEELDYVDVRPLPSNYFRMDATIRSDDSKFELPEEFTKLPGKLIYLSMGSLGSVDVELMTRLTLILSKSKNKFIVSKGMSHDKWDLPANMWGQSFLPQLKVLPKIDLFITHGGNNSLTESLYFGKPMIVLPLFGDQPDNGARVQEKGLGFTFNPFHVTEGELLSSIEKLLADESLARILKKVSERIQNSKSVEQAVNRIEEVVHFARKK